MFQKQNELNEYLHRFASKLQKVFGGENSVKTQLASLSGASDVSKSIPYCEAEGSDEVALRIQPFL